MSEWWELQTKRYLYEKSPSTMAFCKKANLDWKHWMHSQDAETLVPFISSSASGWHDATYEDGDGRCWASDNSTDR